MSSILDKLNKEKIDETVMQIHIILLEKVNVSSEDREHKEEASSR